VIFSIMSNLHPNMKYFAIASLFMYSITFGCTLGPLSWFIAPELVSQRHRATLFCICYGINNVLIAITNFIAASWFSVFLRVPRTQKTEFFTPFFARFAAL
jgi:hypothetical protein